MPYILSDNNEMKLEIISKRVENLQTHGHLNDL
jgi:hypothetical protein